MERYLHVILKLNVYKGIASHAPRAFLLWNDKVPQGTIWDTKQLTRNEMDIFFTLTHGVIEVFWQESASKDPVGEITMSLGGMNDLSER